MVFDSAAMSGSPQDNSIVDQLVEKLRSDVSFRNEIISDPEEALRALHSSGTVDERGIVKKQSPSPACRLTCDYSCHVSCKTTRAFPPITKKKN
jgi:hypothetical protein